MIASEHHLAAGCGREAGLELGYVEEELRLARLAPYEAELGPAALFLDREHHAALLLGLGLRLRLGLGSGLGSALGLG